MLTYPTLPLYVHLHKQISKHRNVSTISTPAWYVIREYIV